MDENTVALHRSGYKEKTTLCADDKIISVNATEISPTTLKDTWLFWNPLELWAYEKTNGLSLVDRLGEKLRSVHQLDGHTLLLNLEQRLTILFPEYLIYQNLLKGPFESLVLDTEQRIIYTTFNAQGHEGLWKLNY